MHKTETFWNNAGITSESQIIRWFEELKRQLERNRTKGATFEEVLYADDTILASEKAPIIQKYIHAIETGSEKYGLKLNTNKCEQININKKATGEVIKFKDGTHVKTLNEVKYLGCMINDKGDPRREV